MADAQITQLRQHLAQATAIIEANKTTIESLNEQIKKKDIILGTHGEQIKQLTKQLQDEINKPVDKQVAEAEQAKKQAITDKQEAEQQLVIETARANTEYAQKTRAETDKQSAIKQLAIESEKAKNSEQEKQEKQAELEQIKQNQWQIPLGAGLAGLALGGFLGYNLKPKKKKHHNISDNNSELN